MKTVSIKGKSYVEVNERLKYFRKHFKGYCLISEIVELTDTRIVIKAKILSPELLEVANGIAYELAGSTFINKTSYIENCETSAWGRCLANFGIGLDNAVASADEVAQAISIQESPSKPKATSEILAKDKGASLDTVMKHYDLTDVQITDYGKEV